MPPKNNPLFSIIVPAYNVEQYLPECIESVLAQSFRDFELILVDDGSTDRTGEICDKYVREHQKSRAEHDKNQPHNSIVAQNTGKVNIKVIHQPNSGPSARNSGVKPARGEYLIFLDSDDYLEPNALQVIHDHLGPGLDLLRFQAQEVFASGEVARYPETGFATTSGTEAFRKFLHYHYIENVWLYAYRRKFFLENRFEYAQGCLAEDFGLTPFIIAKSERVKSISDICYNYRQRPGSIMHSSAPTTRFTTDIEKQFHRIIPELAKVPDSTPVLHYLVASFLTTATTFEYPEFLRFYRAAKRSGWLKYVHPGSLRAAPRAFFLKHWPKVFYRLYRHDKNPQVDANSN